MKIIFTLFLAAAISGLTSSQTKDASNKLIVSVQGFENNDGVVRIALCNCRESYEDKISIYKGLTSSIKNNSVTAEFTDVPFGEYAIKLYHDENSNNKLDTNFIGLPKEDYGFSNNAAATFGMPDYNKVKFSFNKNNQIVKINID